MELLIVVTGCTGTGKTKLGIELAKRYNGEVISADSMQLYRGLSVITNTVTEEEADGILHHCVNYREPGTTYDVKQYTQHTLPIIQDIFRRGKRPIIVGGTVYYIEALLWEFTLSNIDTQTKSEADQRTLESSDLTPYQKLHQIDPESACRLHPNNTRKIERSLEIFEEFGMKQSELLSLQHHNQSVRGKARWDGALIFTMGCDYDVLDVRLDKRVDKMVDLGLVEELRTFCHVSKEKCGLLSQAIGYKEFSEYIQLVNSGTTDPDRLQCALNLGLVKMKTTTRRYARKQIRWVNNRLHNGSYPNYHIHPLNTARPHNWRSEISEPVISLTDQFLSGTLPTQPSVNSKPSKQRVLHCVKCNVTCDCQLSFDAHVASKRHRKRKSSIQLQKVQYLAEINT